MTTLAQPQVSNEVEHVDPLVLEGVSWETYEALRSDLDDAGQHVRVTYDEGRMCLVSPLPKHEKWKYLLGQFVEVIADERDIPISTFGSTTWKRRDRRKGLEPDECFYVQREREVRGKLDFDLRHDPPPDLAIEVDIRRHPVDREA
jgi:Uma2 family endonuclease